MAEHAPSIDISDMPDLLRVVEEVRASHKPRELTRDGETLAVLSPARGRRSSRQSRKPTAEQLASFRAAAGSWADVDTDRLIEDIYETRRRSIRPPVEL
jgi:hypothetical protein